MKLSSVPLSIGCILALIPFPFAGSRSSLEPSHPLMQFLPGVVVEKVGKNSEAEKAGMQPGDVLLSWARGEAQGQLESPFDLSLIEVEEAQRGNVTLEGRRGSERRDWLLGSNAWGIDTRPDFEGRALDIYREGQELAAAGKVSEAVERWRVDAEQSLQAGWGRPWLFFHMATALVRANLAHDADRAYQQAIEISGSSASTAALLLRSWADSLQKRNDLDSAQKYYRQAEIEDEKSGKDSLLLALDFYSLGSVAYKRGNLAEAGEHYHQALAVQTKLAPQSIAIATT